MTSTAVARPSRRVGAGRAIAALGVLVAGACATDSPQPSGGIDLVGAGATFPYPLYSRLISQYAAESGARVNYLSVGSSEGLAMLTARSADFSASEVPLDSTALRALGGSVEQIPMVIGAVVPVYHLPGIARPLRFDGALLADIYLGRVDRWNHARIVALNPGQPLPALDIRPVFRADGSGTTFAFTSFLSAASSAWRDGPGTGLVVRFPIGAGVPGNEGVAGAVKVGHATLGYVEVSYAQTMALQTGLVRDASGEFVGPNAQSLTNGSYPIATTSYVIVRHDDLPELRVRHLVAFLRWTLAHADSAGAVLGYASVGRATRRDAERAIERIAVRVR